MKYDFASFGREAPQRVSARCHFENSCPKLFPDRFSLYFPGFFYYSRKVSMKMLDLYSTLQQSVYCFFEIHRDQLAVAGKYFIISKYDEHISDPFQRQSPPFL